MNKESVINYLKSLLNLKDILIKLLITGIAIFTICLITFLLRDHFITSTSQKHEFMGNFLTISITTNKGVAFSGIENNTPLTYAVQSIFCILIFIIAIFSKDKIIFGCLICTTIGGMCNIIDRAIPDTFAYNGTTEYNTVVDYFQFKFISDSAIFNFQDSVVVCSMITLFIYVVYLFIKKGTKNEDQVSK